MLIHRIIWSVIIGGIVGLIGWYIYPGLEVFGAAAFLGWLFLSGKFVEDN